MFAHWKNHRNYILKYQNITVLVAWRKICAISFFNALWRQEGQRKCIGEKTHSSSLSVDPSATRRTTLGKCAAICINSGKKFINFRIHESKFSIIQEFKRLVFIDNHHRLYVLYMYSATADSIFHNHMSVFKLGLIDVMWALGDMAWLSIK